MKYIINDSGIVLFMNGSPTKINKHDPKYAPIIKALRLPASEQDAAVEAVFIEADVNADMHQQVIYVNEQTSEVTYHGELLPAPLAQKVLSLIRENLPVTLLQNFWKNLKQNPSYNSVRELYDFLAYKELPITEDGCFIAYRGLQGDYYSVHGNQTTKVLKGRVNSRGQIYNGVGEEIEVERNSVDDDRDNSCSFGVHAGSHNYARSWSRGKLVAVKINPKDVVSVPKDYDCQKLRCCAYTVIAEIDHEIESAATDCNGNPLECPQYKEDNEERNKFIDRVDKYIKRRISNGDKFITFRAIQGSFSPQCPSMAEITDAVNALGYIWKENVNGSKGIRCEFLW
jgi:hypothetical protein